MQDRRERGGFKVRGFRNIEPRSPAPVFLPCPELLFLDHFFEVFDRATEGILQLHFGFPFQETACPADVGPSDFWIIGWQRMIGDVAR